MLGKYMESDWLGRMQMGGQVCAFTYLTAQPQRPDSEDMLLNTHL